MEETTRPDKKAILEFYDMWKKHCQEATGNCTRCSMRMLCHTPPFALTTVVVTNSLNYLEQGIMTDEYLSAKEFLEKMPLSDEQRCHIHKEFQEN